MRFAAWRDKVPTNNARHVSENGTIIYAKDQPWEDGWRQMRERILEAFPYPWAEEMATEEFHKKSKKEIGGTAPFKQKPAPLSLVYEIMEDMLSRPEIVECYKVMAKRQEVDDPIPGLLPYFVDYLDHKYGNSHYGNWRAKSGVLHISTGEFSDIYDPALRDYLIKYKKFVTDDDGYHHVR